MPGNLTTLPVDTIRDIFSHIEDESLFIVLRVCRVARILSLVTLLTRHKFHINNSTTVSFSSGDIKDLEENLLHVTKFSFHHHNVPSLMTLAYICLSLPNVVELELDIRSSYPIHLNKLLQRRLVRLICALLGRNHGISNLLVLDDGLWSMSERRREPAGGLDPPGEAVILAWPVTMPILFLIAATRDVRKYLLDPFASKKQKIRLRRDLELLITRRLAAQDSSLNFRLKLKPLPSSIFPSKVHENWSLMVFDESEITNLQMGHGNLPDLPVRGNCGPALPNIHLPMLKSLRICRKASISTGDITPFLVRHPTIEYLSLNHCSLSITPPMSGTRWPMPNLTALEAPLHYLEVILRGIDVRRLTTVCIGKRPGQRSNFIEKKFDFEALDRVMDVLADSGITSLMIVLPGGSTSRAWLTGESAERAERRMSTVQTITIFTELDNHFHQDIIPSLRDWLRLFSSVRLFRCVVPTSWTAGLLGSTTFGVTFRHAYNGRPNSFTHGISWGSCQLCGD